MDSLSRPSPSSSNSEDNSPDGAPVADSTRHTSHTGKQDGLSGLGYGLAVAWHHLRPFIPFFLISCLVVALVYLLQAIIYGGPFKDPLFFVKFNERWPSPKRQDSLSPTKLFNPVPTLTSLNDLFDLHRENETVNEMNFLLVPRGDG